MRLVYVDTGAWIALLWKRDKAHQVVASRFRALRTRGRGAGDLGSGHRRDRHPSALRRRALGDPRLPPYPPGNRRGGRAAHSRHRRRAAQAGVRDHGAARRPRALLCRLPRRGGGPKDRCAGPSSASTTTSGSWDSRSSRDPAPEAFRAGRSSTRPAGRPGPSLSSLLYLSVLEGRCGSPLASRSALPRLRGSDSTRRERRAARPYPIRASRRTARPPQRAVTPARAAAAIAGGT